MKTRTLDLRKVFGMIVTYEGDQLLESPDKPFTVITELYPGGESAVHIHPHQEETYHVTEGQMNVLLKGSWKTVKAGESVIIPKGTVHAFKNTSSDKVVAVNSHNPGLRFGKMLEEIDEHIADGKITSTSGFKNIAYMAGIMVKYNDVMIAVKPPNALIRFMASLGKLFGYKIRRTKD